MVLQVRLGAVEALQLSILQFGVGTWLAPPLSLPP